MSQSTLSIARGGSANLTATVNPSTATDKTVTWSSSNSSVATVNNGTVSAVAVGTATITATASGKTATCQVTVTPKGASSVKLDKNSVSMSVKEVLTLTATVEPTDADDKTVTWTSSDESVAKVDNGKVTAVGKGEATITATAGTLNATCKVTVTYAVNSITLNKSTAQIEEDETLILKATVDTEDPDVKVEWSSDNTSVATIDENGNLVGIKIGSANITAKVGDKTATCAVTVVVPAYIAKERAALVAFYNANNGDSWNIKENWLSDKPLSEWYGVRMTKDGKHVIELILQYNNVDGYIPKEIADLTELEKLMIQNETYLATSSHPLPKEIGQLKKLKKLEIQTYSLSGSLPSSLFDLHDLEYLRIVNGKDMQPSPIPKSIGNLTNLTQLSLDGINLTGSIPSEIGKLTGLTELNLSNNQLTGGIPASFGSLINLDKIDLSVNKLSGPIPTMVARMDNYWKLWPFIFYGNNFTMENLRDSKVPVPISPKIKMLSGKEVDVKAEFSKNKYTVLFRLNPETGDAIECLSQLVSLYKTTKSKGLGIITYRDNNSSGSNRDEKDALFRETLEKCGVTWDSFIRYMYDGEYPNAAPFYAKEGKSMYPYPITNAITIIGPDQTVVYSTLLDNFRVTYGDAIAYLQKVFKTTITHYESKSYSQDGIVTTLQKATLGKGINLVITGDAFSDRLITDGTFEKTAKQAVADLFSAEPYKSMKSRFNIYLVNAVSKHEEYFNGNSTAFGGVFGLGSAVGGNDDKVLEYAKKAVKDDSSMDNVAVLVLMNSLRRGGTCYMTYPVDKTVFAGGTSVCWIPYKDVTVTGGISALASTIVHELGGHGIAKLADEYAYRDQGMMSAEEVELTKYEQSNYSWYLNVDFTSDPKKVLWSQFIGDKNFSSENIGAYEGGFTFWSGIWRPTEQSVMNDSYHHSTFSAPCRSIIYTRIMKLSEGQSWEFDYDAFVAWDKAHPTKVTTRSIVEVDDDEVPVHVPPVRVGKTWQEVIEGR